jgi:5-methylcytosine-specific restriction endonuclease McrA
VALKVSSGRDVDPRFWDVALRDSGKCVYCELDGSQDLRILSTLQLDHLVPKRANGGDNLDNLVLCCSRCNGDKGRWDPTEGLAGELPPRETLIEKVRQYVATQRSRYYADLHTAINSK